jgi:hypothetical protein
MPGPRETAAGCTGKTRIRALDIKMLQNAGSFIWRRCQPPRLKHRLGPAVIWGFDNTTSEVANVPELHRLAHHDLYVPHRHVCDHLECTGLRLIVGAAQCRSSVVSSDLDY